MTLPLNENDLNLVKNLVHHAQGTIAHDSYSIEISITASSGDLLGLIARTEDGEYQFYAGIGAR